MVKLGGNNHPVRGIRRPAITFWRPGFAARAAEGLPPPPRDRRVSWSCRPGAEMLKNNGVLIASLAWSLVLAIVAGGR